MQARRFGVNENECCIKFCPCTNPVHFTIWFMGYNVINNIMRYNVVIQYIYGTQNEIERNSYTMPLNITVIQYTCAIQLYIAVMQQSYTIQLYKAVMGNSYVVQRYRTVTEYRYTIHLCNAIIQHSYTKQYNCAIQLRNIVGFIANKIPFS